MTPFPRFSQSALGCAFPMYKGDLTIVLYIIDADCATAVDGFYRSGEGPLRSWGQPRRVTDWDPVVPPEMMLSLSESKEFWRATPVIDVESLVQAGDEQISH